VPAAEIDKELAESAARLHRLYVEQLSNSGRNQAIYHQQVQSLQSQIQNLSSYLDQVVEPLVRSRWHRLGAAFGAVEQPPAPPQLVPAASGGQ
jgi:hypothetical protein